MLAAFDAKEFRRGGDRRPVALGEKPRSRGFFTQLGAGVVVEDATKFARSYSKEFKALRERFGLEMDSAFCSSFALRRHFGGDVDRAFEFGEALVAKTLPMLKEIHLNYPILTEEGTLPIRVGGRKGAQDELSASQFLRRLGNFFPVVCAWWYMRNTHVASKAKTVVLDQVETPVIPAWTELARSARPSIYPNGDECYAPLAAADLIAWVTDMRLGVSRLYLTNQNLREVWRDANCDVHAFSFGSKFLHAMKWIDSAPARIGASWKHPMTFLMVDNALRVHDAPPTDEDEDGNVRIRDWVEERGWMDSIFAHAQRVGGGAKSFNPGDRGFVQDGDFIVYLGEQSKRRAETFADAVDVTVMSLKEIRKKGR